MKPGDLILAPGALWRRAKTSPSEIVLGKVLGEGSFSKVHHCIFQNRKAACKIFRNTTEESAFKEIEIMFALRHPNIIGLYAWFQVKGGFRRVLESDVLLASIHSDSLIYTTSYTVLSHTLTRCT